MRMNRFPLMVDQAHFGGAGQAALLHFRPAIHGKKALGVEEPGSNGKLLIGGRSVGQFGKLQGEAEIGQQEDLIFLVGSHFMKMMGKRMKPVMPYHVVLVLHGQLHSGDVILARGRLHGLIDGVDRGQFAQFVVECGEAASNLALNRRGQQQAQPALVRAANEDPNGTIKQA